MPARFLFVLICISFSVSASDSPTVASNPEYRQWIETMKTTIPGC